MNIFLQHSFKLLLLLFCIALGPGNLIIGMKINNGIFTVYSIYFCAIELGAILYVYTKQLSHSIFKRALFSLITARAFFLSLVWILWKLNFALAIDGVITGEIAGVEWVIISDIVLSIVSYLYLAYENKTSDGPRI